jgi:hypothetical protein
MDLCSSFHTISYISLQQEFPCRSSHLVCLKFVSPQVGCLYIDSKSLRNDLMPITTSTLDRIKTLLLEMSRETCLKVSAMHGFGSEAQAWVRSSRSIACSGGCNLLGFFAWVDAIF